MALRYVGTRPDLGAYEFAPGGNQPPVASFIVKHRADDYLTVVLDGSDSYDPDGKIAWYDWDFGDGMRRLHGPAKVRHTYDKPGRYLVRLKVSDGSGDGLVGTAKLIVSVGKPVLDVSTRELHLCVKESKASFEIRNIGEGTLGFDIGSSVPWLSVEPRRGNCMMDGKRIAVQVSRAGLRPGLYRGTIIVKASTGEKHTIVTTMEVPRVKWIRLIKVGDEWSFFKGTRPPPRGWRSVSFDDSGWLRGRSGIGYSNDVHYGTVVEDMRGNYVTVYMRRAFSISDPASVVGLRLGVQYDDGFVAYLNGVEVARSASMGAPNIPVPYDRCAVSKHDEELPEEIFPIELKDGLLSRGKNVLAIEFHNEWIKSSDAGMIPRLDASVVVGDVSERIPNLGLIGGICGAGVATMIGLWLLRGDSGPKLPGGRGAKRVSNRPLNRLSTRDLWLVLNWVAIGATVTAIVALSYCPPGMLGLGGQARKAHAMAYGVLALLLLSGLSRSGKLVRVLSAPLRALDRRLGLMKVFAVMVLILLFGAANELAQPWVGRQRSLGDLAANLVGACLAVLLYFTLRSLVGPEDKR